MEPARLDIVLYPGFVFLQLFKVQNAILGAVDTPLCKLGFNFLEKNC